jgi:hypothetical protein
MQWGFENIKELYHLALKPYGLIGFGPRRGIAGA